MAKAHSRRAALRAALSVSAVIAALRAPETFFAPALARMRVERLTIEPQGGAAPLVFDVEIAESDQEKQLGLMFRTKLADSEGMLFPYGKNGSVTMWMHDTYIPLDMVFVREDGRIARIEAEAEPLSDRIISSEGEVFAVLELAGGAAKRLGIQPGDRVRHAVFERH